MQFNQLYTIAERIGYMHTVLPRELRLPRNGVARGLTLSHQFCETVNPERGMCLPGRLEGFLYSQVHMDGAGAEPCTPAPRQRTRFRNLSQAENPAIKRPGFRLAASRHCQLHMVNRYQAGFQVSLRCRWVFPRSA
jgi:hypothetical protein